MKKASSFIAAALLAAQASARPSVSGVSFAQADDGEVTVSYTLSGAPAVVTGGFLTNGVPVEDASFTTLYGDVNRLVETDGAHSFRWLPWRDVGDVRIDAETCKASVTAWTPEEPPDVIVLNLASNADCRVSYYPSVEAMPGGILSNWNYRTMLLPLKRVRAKGRVFTFGAPAGTPSRDASAAYRTVTFREDWWMSLFMLTQGQLNMIRCGKGRSGFENVCGDVRPANCAGLGEYREGPCTCDATYRDAAYRYPHSPHPDSLAGRLHALTGLYLEPPSDAQWQYTCLAGLEYGWMGHAVTNAVYDAHYAKIGRCKYNGGWVKGADGTLKAPDEHNCPPWDGGTAICGAYPPNPWGFYDFYGNLSEIVLDETSGYKKATSGHDPSGEPYRNPAYDSDDANRKYVTVNLGTWNGDCGCGQGAFGAGGLYPNNKHVGYRLVWRAGQKAKYTDLQEGEQ